MPELPEVETTLRGLAPYVTGRTILELVLRTAKLRNQLDHRLCDLLPGQTIRRLERRAKYLLFYCDQGGLILHLGMTGQLRVVPAGSTERRHDHVELIFTDGQALRFTDPRRFGLFLYWPEDPGEHPLLRNLGPEPLTADFHAPYLYRLSRGRKVAIKPFIMDQRRVVGVGNIYASEALFRSGIDPRRSAGRISLQRYRRLVDAIKIVLEEAIAAGGTTISDFIHADGQPGFFTPQLQVYGRSGQPCRQCGQALKGIRLGQRSTYFCPRCQR